MRFVKLPAFPCLGPTVITAGRAIIVFARMSEHSTPNCGSLRVRTLAAVIAPSYATTEVTIEEASLQREIAMQLPLPITRTASAFSCPRIHLIFAALVMTVACHSARAQDDMKPLTLEIPKPGVAQAFPVDTAVPSGVADARLFSSIASAEALATQFKEAIPHTRGPQDISLFREAAPSVVLILAKDHLGLALCSKTM